MKKIDLRDFMQRHNIQIAEEIHLQLGKVYILEHWIFNPDQRTPRVAIVEYNNGKIAYENPDGYTWRDVVRHFEPELLNGESEETHNVAPKYKLTDETIEWNGTILHRIECVADCDDVKAGEKGGFIESEENLSQSGYCWVGDNAYVCDNAKVIDNAIVCDNAKVVGNALICDCATVRGDAFIGDNAKILGSTIIKDDAFVEGDATIRESHIGGIAKICGDVFINNGSAYEMFITSNKDYERYRSAIARLCDSWGEVQKKNEQLRSYLERNNIKVLREIQSGFGTRFILEHCIFNPEHIAPDAMIFLYDDGAISYKCFHKSCADKTWKDVVELLGPFRESESNPQDSWYDREKDNNIDF